MDLEAHLLFESKLYQENPELRYVKGLNNDFVVDKLINYPRYRPFHMKDTVELCKEYCESEDFRQKLLSKVINACPSLIYRLYKMGTLSFEEIEVALPQHTYDIIYLYFHKEFSNSGCINEDIYSLYSINKEFFDDNERVELILEYGFHPSSLEYCLKYDDDLSISEQNIDLSKYIDREYEWSIFEWSKKPLSRNYLAFAGFFGSVRCFRKMILIGFCVDIHIAIDSISSGSNDIYHMLKLISNRQFLKNAVEFCHIPLMQYLIDQEEKNEIHHTFYILTIF